MDEQRFINKGTAVKAVSLLLWAFFLLYLLVSSRYLQYLSPGMGFWIIVTALLILCCMIAGLCGNLTEKHEHDRLCREENKPCSWKHRLRVKHFRPLFLFAFPICIVFLIPLSRGLSAHMSGGVFSDSFRETLETEIEETKRPEIDGVPEYVITEVLGAPSRMPEKIAVIGMVYKGSTTEKPDFMLVRFYITCCAADARALMIKVTPLPDSGIPYEQLKDNQWVSVTGKTVKKDSRVFLQAEKIKKAEKPKFEYLY